MSESPDVYQMLRDELEENMNISKPLAFSIVSYLDDRGLLDYDVLKEVYLYPDEEED